MTYPFYHLVSSLEFVSQILICFLTYYRMMDSCFPNNLTLINCWKYTVNYSVLKQLSNTDLCFNKYTNKYLLKSQNYFPNSKFLLFLMLLLFTQAEYIPKLIIASGSLTASADPPQPLKDSNTFCASRENKLSSFLLL